MDRPSAARRAAHRLRSVAVDRTRRVILLGVSAGLYVADAALGAVAPPLRRGRRATGVVLMYHDIEARHRERFTAQCAQIASLGHPTALVDMHGPVDGTWRIAVTFDDGFRSFAHLALPELDRHGIPSALFVPTEWSHRSQNRSDEPQALVTADGTAVVLLPEELAALPGSVEVGSHSREHPRLPVLDDDELRTELAGSREDLNRLGRGPVRFHAFPFGDHDDRVDEAARAAGYERCYGIAPTVTTPGDDYVVGRVQVEPTDWPIEFRLKVLGAYRWMSWWMAAKKRLTARTSMGAAS